MVTIAAALEEKLTNPNELFDCQMGSIVINGRRIHDWKPYGVLSVSDILAKSSDVGAIKIALRLGDERLYKYIRAFGFGQQTGIELPAETRGITKPVNKWSQVSIGAISMGQEIGVSPLQLSAMVSTIANDGVWVAPRIVAGTVAAGNAPQLVAFHPGEQRRVLSTATAAQMKQMMQGVVLHGTGRKAILEGYSSAGKTGTAQKIDPTTGTYSRTKHIASFAGFAPVNNPAVAIVVILDSPLGEHHGGTVGAPVFNRVAQQVLEYLHTQHDVELPANRQLLMAERKVNEKELEEGSPDRVEDGVEAAEAAAVVPPPTLPLPAPAQTAHQVVVQATLNEREPIATTVNQKPVVDSVPAPPPPRPTSGTVVLNVEQGGTVVPSFLGKSVRAAIEQAQDSGLDLEAVGSGVGRDQSPPPGSHVPSGARIVVKFGR